MVEFNYLRDTNSIMFAFAMFGGKPEVVIRMRS